MKQHLRKSDRTRLHAQFVTRPPKLRRPPSEGFQYPGELRRQPYQPPR